MLRRPPVAQPSPVGVDQAPGLGHPAPGAPARPEDPEVGAPVPRPQAEPVARGCAAVKSFAAPLEEGPRPASPGQDAVSRILACTEPIDPLAARRLVAGKTEKPWGSDPGERIDEIVAAGAWKRILRIGHIPLELFRENEEGDRYDGTVNLDRALGYKARPGAGAPPILGGASPRTHWRINVLDGGHRITAARLRGDETIYAIIQMPRCGD